MLVRASPFAGTSDAYRAVASFCEKPSSGTNWSSLRRSSSLALSSRRKGFGVASSFAACPNAAGSPATMPATTQTNAHEDSADGEHGNLLRICFSYESITMRSDDRELDRAERLRGIRRLRSRKCLDACRRKIDVEGIHRRGSENAASDRLRKQLGEGIPGVESIRQESVRVHAIGPARLLPAA